MKAIIIIINNSKFLLPGSHQFYEFPSYIEKHKDDIVKHIELGKKVAENPLIEHSFSSLPNLDDFKRITGIIGHPFDMRDPELYALDKSIEIVLEVTI